MIPNGTQKEILSITVGQRKGKFLDYIQNEKIPQTQRTDKVLEEENI